MKLPKKYQRPVAIKIFITGCLLLYFSHPFWGQLVSIFGSMCWLWVEMD